LKAAHERRSERRVHQEFAGRRRSRSSTSGQKPRCYARTLHEWRRNLLANLPAVRALGYDDAFIRMWEFYFCYCEGGFAERVVGDVQMLLVKPGNRRPSIATADISAVR